MKSTIKMLYNIDINNQRQTLWSSLVQGMKYITMN